jgi:stringent starvation protein B
MTPEEPALNSTKPYLVRAIYEWILDNGLTPHLLVDAQYPGVQVPAESVQDGQIVLNVAPGAVRNLTMGNDWISFEARFGGVPRELMVPSEAVLGIFSRENRQGMVFPPPEYPHEAPSESGTLPIALKGPTPVSVPGGGRDEKTTSTKGKGKGKGGPSLKVVK